MQASKHYCEFLLDMCSHIEWQDECIQKAKNTLEEISKKSCTKSRRHQLMWDLHITALLCLGNHSELDRLFRAVEIETKVQTKGYTIQSYVSYMHNLSCPTPRAQAT